MSRSRRRDIPGPRHRDCGHPRASREPWSDPPVRRPGRRGRHAFAGPDSDRDATRAADGRYFVRVSEDSRSPEDEEPPEERAFDYARTVALSDGVFAIALTLLVLNITLPAIAHGHESELGRKLLDRGGEFESYALSFAVISLL